MPEFRGYLCWDPTAASGAIKTEAVVPSEAVFMATHTPLRIRRAHIKGRSLELMQGKADEYDVLRDFTEREPDTGTLLMPVVGDTGTGKSHLVRWVGIHIPVAEQYQVIYLEKSQTSLRAVVETLLADTESSALSKLRNDIESFSAGLDATALSRRLINALNESLAQTTPGEMSGISRALAGSRGLASILQDPNIQENMLAEGKFIPLLASQLLRNRNDSGSRDRPPGFTVDDLPLQANVMQAAQIAQVLLRQLLTIPGLRTAAVDLLNQYLEAAVRSAYQLGAGRLSTAMLQVREEYARQGKSIILLIEDFALIQGVQRELLDAITEPAIRDGKVRYAPIRTLMAVTTGYFTDLPETVMSRVAAATTGYVYDLDVPFSQRDDGTEEIASFAGRYLNAARVGQKELDRLGAGNSPNKCDGCDFRAECHGAFGSSAEGYGLYPFNRPALARTVHSINSQAASAQDWAFVPRAVLGGVLRPVLIDDSAALQDGAFPDERFRERFPGAAIDHVLPNTVAQTVNEYDQSTPDQRKLILEFWGDAPTDANDVATGILQAFGLQPLPAEAGSPDHADHGQRTTRREPRHEAGRPAAPVDKSLTRKTQNVEEWAARPQGLLGSDIARELRVIVADAIIHRYTFRSPLMKEQPKADMAGAWPKNGSTIFISDAGTRIQGADTAPVRFERTPLNSLFFQSLLRAKTDVESARAEDIRRLASMAEEYSAVLTAHLQRHMEITDADLTVALRASLLGAALAGQVWPGCAETELLSAAFDDGSTWLRGDCTRLTPQWQQTLDFHQRHRANLVAKLRSSVGIAQGTGAVRMIDAARVLPLLREAATGWTWRADTPVPEWVKPAVSGFSRWDALVEEQFGLLSTSVARIRQLLPAGGRSGSDTAEEVRRAVEESATVGVAPSRDDALRLQALLTRVEKANWRVVSEAGDDLGKARAGSSVWEARVKAVARDRGKSLGAIRDFLDASDHFLDDALASAASRRDPVGDDAARQVASLLKQWDGLLTQEEESQ